MGTMNQLGCRRGSTVAGGDAQATDTPEVFLAKLGTALGAQPQADAELATILTAHLIKADPAQNAVASAKDAILKLAAERASRQGGGAEHG